MNCPSQDTEPTGIPRFNLNGVGLDHELPSKGLANTAAARSAKTLRGDASLKRLRRPGDDPDRFGSGDDDSISESYELSSVPSGKIYPVLTHTTPASYPTSASTSTTSSTTGINGTSNGYSGSGIRRRHSVYQTSTEPRPELDSDSIYHQVKGAFTKYLAFVGPGFMISVAYIDPGNYSTDVAAGAMFRFRLLFVVMLSNLFAIFLQALCAKLGSVTGLDLAQNCRAHFPRWFCVLLYILAETAIIATDLAEVVGTAISLNILFKVPLVIGVAITIVDVLIVLIAYRPDGSLKAVRWFEYAVAALVIAVVACFCVELSKISGGHTGEILRGFLPSKSIFTDSGLYYSCGILGATVMPHSLYLGSGLVQPRLREFDELNGTLLIVNDSLADIKYRPSLAAIRHALKYSIVELAISLLSFALFVNCAILIVSGATLSDTPGAAEADLFSIHSMLSASLSTAAGTIFALALLFSGLSAGIVCTLSGQMVSEGFLHWTMRPWLRRLVTRSVAIVPCIAVAAMVGREGLGDVLNLSQVILSLLLPFVSAPLIYFTCRNSIMRVPVFVPADNTFEDHDDDSSIEYGMRETEYADMSNSPFVTIVGILIWLFISALNLYFIFSIGMSWHE
ncbi:natural resistance-associated macrophage protein-domain-containing protein [Limtongia smithiae]|uniref:natural resistance-associated macrophage protein-domain-containing protein n=1 Tax=Limtongia smithiae TaxID=1125753 RepID=UPI0034CF34A0